MEEYVYGLDFGTSTTLMAIPREGMPQILPIGRSDNWMPSLIGLGDGGDVVVGDFASDKPHGDQIRSPKTAITREQFGNLVSPSGKTIEADLAIVNILEEVSKKAKELGLKLIPISNSRMTGILALMDRSSFFMVSAAFCFSEGLENSFSLNMTI